MPNIILVIADGTGIAHYSMLFQDLNARKVFAGFTQSLLVHTSPHSCNNASTIKSTKLSPVTESASSATALSTGKWTERGRIATSVSGKRLSTLAEISKKKGYQIGVVCTTDICDATPASFLSHAHDREDYDEILHGICKFNPDVMVAGGDVDLKTLSNNMSIPPKYIHQLKKYRTKNEIAKQIKHIINNVFSVDRSYFLIIEESNIDKHSHQQDMKGMTRELASLGETVKTCLDLAKRNGNTRVILVSDHATGGLVIDNNDSDTYSSARFTSGAHDNHLVPCYVYNTLQVLPSIVDMCKLHEIIKNMI